MKSGKSELDNAATAIGKPESPDEAVKSGKTDLSRRKLISRIGLGATLLAVGGQAYSLHFGNVHASWLHREDGAS